MTVLIEFTLPADSFPFGRSVGGDSDMRVQLERVVPIGQSRIPFIWATGGEFDRFERHVRNSEVVKEVEALTRAGESVLYRVVWHEAKESFLNGIADQNGSIMEGHGKETFSFTVRFQNHADLTRFHRFYQSHDYPVNIDRVYALDEERDTRYGLGITPEQCEALTMAVEDGYFSVPRETKLDEIAEELGITRQAASERVRRGAEVVLRKSLIGLVGSDFRSANE